MSSEYEVHGPHDHEVEHAAHGAHRRDSLTGRIAVTTAILATLGALCAYQGGNAESLALYYKNEEAIAKTEAANQWGYYQAKGVKSAVLQSRVQLLGDLGKTAHPEDEARLEQYKKEQEEISEQAKHHEEESEHHLKVHETLAKSVTLFQVSIAISAISVLTRRRRFWYVGLVSGAVGVLLFVQGLFRV